MRKIDLEVPDGEPRRFVAPAPRRAPPKTYQMKPELAKPPLVKKNPALPEHPTDLVVAAIIDAGNRLLIQAAWPPTPQASRYLVWLDGEMRWTCTGSRITLEVGQFRGGSMSLSVCWVDGAGVEGPLSHVAFTPRKQQG